MAFTTTLYVQSCSTPAGNFSSSTGGILAVTITHSASDIQDRVADNEYPTFVAMVNKSLTVRVTIRQVKLANGPGVDSAGSIVIVLKSKDATTVTITCATMILRDVDMNQPRGDVGQTVLTFVHQSADGTANPVT